MWPSILLFVAVSALGILTWRHRSTRPELAFGLAFLLVALWMQLACVPNGSGYEASLRFAHWWAFDGGAANNSFIRQFFGDNRYPQWLMNVFLLFIAALIWLAWRWFVRRRPHLADDDLLGIYRGAPSGRRGSARL